MAGASDCKIIGPKFPVVVIDMIFLLVKLLRENADPWTEAYYVRFLAFRWKVRYSLTRIAYNAMLACTDMYQIINLTSNYRRRLANSFAEQYKQYMPSSSTRVG